MKIKIHKPMSCSIIQLKNNCAYYSIAKVASRSILRCFIDLDLIEQKEELASEFNFSFAIVRNPWERLLSAWKDKVEKQWSNSSSQNRLKDFERFKNKSFDFFVKNFETNLNPHVELQVNSVHPDVDFIGKLDNLENDFKIILDKIGAPQTKIEQKNMTKHSHYSNYYDNTTKQIVAEKYARDIEHFGFKFDQK